MILAHKTSIDCPDGPPSLHVGQGSQFTDGTDDWCAHADSRLEPPSGTTTDEEGAPVPPSGWQFSLDGLSPKDEEPA